MSWLMTLKYSVDTMLLGYLYWSAATVCASLMLEATPGYGVSMSRGSKFLAGLIALKEYSQLSL